MDNFSKSSHPLRKYLLPFLVSAPVTILYFYVAAAPGFLMGFGNAPHSDIKMWEVLYWGGYSALVVALTFLFSKKGRRPLATTFIAVVLPGILFWGFLIIDGYISDKVILTRQAEYEEFYAKSVKALPENAEFLEPRYMISSAGKNFDFTAELVANISHEFDSKILKGAFKFRINDIENKYWESNIIPKCDLFPHDVRLKSEEPNKRYGPGEYRVLVNWRFFGPNCSEDELRSLSGERLIIRGPFKILTSFTIGEIEVFH